MKYALAALGIVILLVVVFLIPRSESEQPPVVTGNTYESEEHGIAFTYPDGFVLAETDAGNGEREHDTIVIVREEDATPVPDSEGPIAVTIDVYQNNLDNQTLLGWMTGSNQSNFKLGPGTYASSTVDGREAVTYRWSGLYEGETTAFLSDTDIVAVSVTSLTPEDETIDAYRMVLTSMRVD